MKYKVPAGNAERIIKKMMYLAWKGCGGTSGLGFLQDRGDQTEDQVWGVMYNRLDYPGGNTLYSNTQNKPGRVYADYVNGRMMKIGFDWTTGEEFDTIECTNTNWRSDYQGFSRVYPNLSSLLEAAVKELGIPTQEVAVAS